MQREVYAHNWWIDDKPKETPITLHQTTLKFYEDKERKPGKSNPEL